MREDRSERRFLRDNEVDDLRKQTKELLDQLTAAEAKFNLVFDHINDDTLERMKRGRDTLSLIESAINLLRHISPPPDGPIKLLVAGANEIQAEQREIRSCLAKLLRRLRLESLEDEDA